MMDSIRNARKSGRMFYLWAQLISEYRTRITFGEIAPIAIGAKLTIFDF